MTSKALFLALCVALMGAAAAQRGTLSADLKNDRAALMTFYNQLSGAGGSALPTSMTKTWGAAKNPCAPVWKYVTCANGRVTGLALQNLNLNGSLVEPLQTLTALQTLDLRGNGLNGTLPASWANRRYFQSLTTLILSNNKLFGTLPSAWATVAGAFPALTTLDLSINDLSGAVPDSWTRRGFRSLQNLVLSGNDFSGALPETWGTPNVLPSIMRLDLSDNSFSGTLPAVWGNASAFQYAVYIDLSNNNLDGELPTTWAATRSFPRLRDLVLSQNNLGKASAPANMAATNWLTAGAFPKMDTLVLFPGNGYICGTNTVATGGSEYRIIDELGSEFNGEDIACPAANSISG